MQCLPCLPTGASATVTGTDEMGCIWGDRRVPEMGESSGEILAWLGEKREKKRTQMGRRWSRKGHIFLVRDFWNLL